MPAPDTCGGCGRTIPDDAPGEVCPVCLATALLTDGGSRVQRRSVPASSLDGFNLREKLGEGGFGSVYAADQLHPVRRRVAIKILKSGAHHEQALARFEAERQALALLEHPNIAHVFDAGETDDGQPFFVMELIDGKPVTDYCREHGLDLAARLTLFLDLCGAIAHAHRRGIIHRDLKPSNLLVSTKDGRPVPKVIDFGIAKATDDHLTERTLVTQNNQLLGTPAYMSPEQAAATTLEVDTRTDLYSLGVLLYELITGSAPFPAAELHALPYDEALRRIRTVDPPRPSVRLRQDRQPLPPSSTDLDAVVMKAIDKDPERRYETVGALARDLSHYLAGEAVQARPASAVYRLRKFVRKNRGLVAAASMVTLSLVAGTVVSLSLFFQARTSARRATESEAAGKERFSYADFTQATPFLDDNRPGLAVAHLARAVRTNPSNHAATARLLETLATGNWPIPAFPGLPAGGMAISATYTSDGALLITSSKSGQIGVWDPATGQSLHSLTVDGIPGSVIISPDDSRIAVLVPQSGKIHLWALPRYELLATLAAPPGRGGLIGFSPDGRSLLASHDNGHTHLWDLDRLKLRKCIPQEGGYVRAFFSPQGERIATHHQNHIRVWDLDGAAVFAEPFAHDAEVAGTLFTPDGSRLLSWSADHTARLWDLSTGEPALPPFRHGNAVRQAALDPAGIRLVTATTDDIVQLWDLATGAPLGAPHHHDGTVTRLSFSPDGNTIASCSEISRIGDGAVKVWDAATGELVVSPIYHPRGASFATFRPDGRQLAIGSRHDEVAVWDIRPRAMAPLRLAVGQPVWRAIFDQDDRELVTLTLDGEARAWNAASGLPFSFFPVTAGPVAIRAHAAANGASLRSGFRQGRFFGQPHWTLPAFERLVAPAYREGTVQCAAASEEGRLLVTGCRDHRVRIWSLGSGNRLGPPLEMAAPVTSVALDAAGTRLAAGADDGSVRVFDLTSGQLLASLHQHDQAVLALAFSPDGAVLASGSADHHARLWWGTSSSAPLTHDGDVTQLSFSPDGGRLATGSRDNTVRVWDTTSAGHIAGPLRHIDTASQPGLFALWSPDRSLLVTTASHDDTARSWDPATGRMLARPMLQPSCPLSAALSPSGRTLLLGGDHDFQTRTWDPASGEPLGPFLKHNGRILSCAFNRRGQRYVVGTRTGFVFVHDFPAFTEPLSPAALALAEALGGFRFDHGGVLEQVPAREWADARDRILASDAPDLLAKWMHWLADDPSRRAPSPFRESLLPR